MFCVGESEKFPPVVLLFPGPKPEPPSGISPPVTRPAPYRARPASTHCISHMHAVFSIAN